MEKPLNLEFGNMKLSCDFCKKFFKNFHLPTFIFFIFAK